MDLVGLDRAMARRYPGAALRRPAAARRRGPRARRRPQHPADGRAVRRRRPDRAGRPAGRNSCGSSANCTRRSSSSPTTSTRRSPSATRSSSSRPTARSPSCGTPERDRHPPGGRVRGRLRRARTGRAHPPPAADRRVATWSWTTPVAQPDAWTGWRRDLGAGQPRPDRGADVVTPDPGGARDHRRVPDLRAHRLGRPPLPLVARRGAHRRGSALRDPVAAAVHPAADDHRHHGARPDERDRRAHPVRDRADGPLGGRRPRLGRGRRDPGRDRDRLRASGPASGRSTCPWPVRSCWPGCGWSR